MRGIRPWAQAALRCPVCHGELAEPEPDAADGGPAGGSAAAVLHCAACQRSFPVHDGIPVLLPESQLR